MFTSKNENRKEIVFLFCFFFFSFLTLLYIQKDKKVSKEMCVSVIFNFFFFFRHGNRRRYDLKRRAFFFFLSNCSGELLSGSKRTHMCQRNFLKGEYLL